MSKPKVLKAEHIVCYDVDGTLIRYKVSGGISISNPLTDEVHQVVEHKSHIDLLKSHSARGYYVRVWSAAGYRWAQTVVKKLGLEDYVDSIETKPALLVDDLEVNQIFPARVFIKE